MPFSYYLLDLIDFKLGKRFLGSSQADPNCGRVAGIQRMELVPSASQPFYLLLFGPPQRAECMCVG